MRRGAIVGMFDGVHLGHQSLAGELHAASLARGLVPTAFTFDRHPLSVVSPGNEPRLLTPLPAKISLLRQAGATDVSVLTFNDGLRRLTSAQFLHMLHVEYGVEMLIVGFNHRFGSDTGATFDHYAATGAGEGIEVIHSAEFVMPGLDERISSSNIRASLVRGDITIANTMLGRPYCITGTVAHGRGIGHTIGFPTANVEPESGSALIPAAGVYVARCTTGGRSYRAIVNIGRCPTVTDGTRLTIEAHLLDFHGDLYNLDMCVEFLARLRDERKFPSLDALAAQLQADRLAALNHPV